MIDKEISNRPILTLNGTKETGISVQKTTPLSVTKKDDLRDEKDLSTSKTVNTETTNAVTKDPSPTTPKYYFNAIYDELHTKFPNIININKPVLLAIGIRQELLKEVSDVPNNILHRWIAWYFRKSNYYAAHKLGAVRYNLDGSEAGIVTEKDQAKRDKNLEKINDTNSKSQDHTQEKATSPTQIKK